MDIRWLRLKEVSGEIEADILVALLESENIPVKKVYPGYGSLKGTFGLVNGVELYVPREFFGLARELLEALPEPDADF